MGHQHQCARKLQQTLFKNLQRRNIQIVGRLIQQQQIGGFQHQLRDQHPRPLPAHKPLHRLIQLSPVNRNRAAHEATCITRS